MDIGAALLFLMDLPIRVVRRLRGESVDYRGVLFEELKHRLAGSTPKRVLEIGPRDGLDTRRLMSLQPKWVTLVDLPNQKPAIEKWLPSLQRAPNEIVFGNLMFDSTFNTIETFDLIWCTGVLYHNPEQLRLIRQLFDLTAPGGLLVIETATARRPRTRNENCVEIWYPPDRAASRASHVSTNVTHLPSAKAVLSWLQMIGFSEIDTSACHRRVTRALAADRIAYIAKRPADGQPGIYYGHAGHEFHIGSAR